MSGVCPPGGAPPPPPPPDDAAGRSGVALSLAVPLVGTAGAVRAEVEAERSAVLRFMPAPCGGPCGSPVAAIALVGDKMLEVRSTGVSGAAAGSGGALSSGGRKSARLAERGSVRAMERAVARKSRLREGSPPGSGLEVGSLEKGCDEGEPSSRSSRHAKLKCKGARCGIELSDDDVCSLKAFLEVPF